MSSNYGLMSLEEHMKKHPEMYQYSDGSTEWKHEPKSSNDNDYYFMTLNEHMLKYPEMYQMGDTSVTPHY